MYYVLKAVVDPDIPPNAGYYRAIAVSAPRGSLLNPTPPAAVAARFTTCQKVADVVLDALAPVLPGACRRRTATAVRWPSIPGSIPAAASTSWTTRSMRAEAARGRPKTVIDGIANHTTNTSNLPIEALETEFPILVERYEFVPDSGGPGRFRGGLSVVREVRGLHGDLVVGGWGCNQREAPRGLFGGEPGVAGGFHVVDAEGFVRETVRSTVKGIQLPPRGRLRVHTSGGGGYGDPLDRDPELVLRDIGAGKVSLTHAKTVYGVLVTAAGVDRAATERMRAARRARASGGR